MPRTRFCRQTQKFLRFLLWIALVGLRSVFRWIPRPLGLRIGSGLGAAAYDLLRSERRRTLSHLRQALAGERPPDEIPGIARESFKNLGRVFMEVLSLDRLTRTDLDRLVYFDGEEPLKAAAGLGRGVIFVTGHIGNWELLGLSVAMRYRLAVVAAPIYDRRVEEIMIRLRAAHGIETLIRDAPGSLRRLLSTLRSGGVVGLLIDQDTKTDGVFVPFFHRDAYTPIGAARLAYRTGAAVVVGFILREPGGRHRIVVEGPMVLPHSDNRERDVWDQTARFTKMIEDQIRKTPEQWIWMHRRWRTARPSASSETSARTGPGPRRSIA